MKKAFKNDGYFRIFIVYGVVLLVVGLITHVTYEDFVVYFWFYLGAVSAVILFAIRYLYLKNFNKNIKKIQCLVKSSFYYRGSKIVTVVYNFEEKAYKKRLVLNYTKMTQSIEKDREIELVIQPNRPKNVLIPELYFDE